MQGTLDSGSPVKDRGTTVHTQPAGGKAINEKGV